jgi:diacylglycerol kinase (ATP)
MIYKKDFIINRLKSTKYALKGAITLLKTEASIQVQFFISIITICAGIYFNISATEWMFQILSIGLVISIEGANTAIEAIADFIHPEYHKKIGLIKDVAAGAVFIAATAAIIIGLIIYIPKVMVL